MKRILITAGPTHEPIDSVRFIGNRSSGKMGFALVQACVAKGWDVTFLLGPVGTVPPAIPNVRIERFRTCADLQRLLDVEAAAAELIIMAAAVADYRPKPNPAMSGGKFRRSSEALKLELEPTPDLIAQVAARRVSGQVLVGFALEPRGEMVEAAARKLARKGLDFVVANPLETMDSVDVEGVVVRKDGSIEVAPRLMPKPEFARWLVAMLAASSGERGCCLSCSGIESPLSAHVA
jgi:phosphopantothenoylcysteine decarboxylase/phosphopantothenate--cysteine ligase